MSQAQIQASPEEDVLYEVSEHIATITINRLSCLYNKTTR